MHHVGKAVLCIAQGGQGLVRPGDVGAYGLALGYFIVGQQRMVPPANFLAFDPQYTTNPQGGKGAGVKSLLIPGAKQGIQSGGEEEQADPLGGGQPQENAPVGIPAEKFQQEPGRGV